MIEGESVKASSLVIYMKSARRYINRLRIGRSFFRTTRYEWDHSSTQTQQRAPPPTSSITSSDCGLCTADMGNFLCDGQDRVYARIRCDIWD